MSELAGFDFCLELSGKAVRDIIQTTVDGPDIQAALQAAQQDLTFAPGAFVTFNTDGTTDFFKATLMEFDVRLLVSPVDPARLSANWVLSFDCGWLSNGGTDTYGLSGTLTFQMDFDPIVQSKSLMLRPLSRQSSTDYPAGAPPAVVTFTNPTGLTYLQPSDPNSPVSEDVANNALREWADGFSNLMYLAFLAKPPSFALPAITVDSTTPGTITTDTSGGADYQFMSVTTITVTDGIDTSFCLLGLFRMPGASIPPSPPPVANAKTIAMRKGHDAAAFVAGWVVDHFFVRPSLGATVLGVTAPATDAQLASLPPLLGTGGAFNMGIDTFLFRFEISLDPFTHTVLKHAVRYTECRGFGPSVLVGDTITTAYRHGLVGDCYDITLPVSATYEIINTAGQGPTFKPPTIGTFGTPGITINWLCLVLATVLALIPCIGPELALGALGALSLPLLLNWLVIPGRQQQSNFPDPPELTVAAMFTADAAHTVDAENALGIQMSTTSAQWAAPDAPTFTVNTISQTTIDAASLNYTTAADGCPPNKTYTYTVQHVQQTQQVVLAVPGTCCRPVSVGWFLRRTDGSLAQMAPPALQPAQTVEIDVECQLASLGYSYPVAQPEILDYHISDDSLTLTLTNHRDDAVSFTVTVQCFIADAHGVETIGSVDVTFNPCNLTPSQDYLNDVAACAAAHALGLQNVKNLGHESVDASVLNQFLPPWVAAADVPAILQPIYEQIGRNATASLTKAGPEE
jgi:hypothetical protein